MPDRGLWTLRCPNCNEVSSIQVKPGESLLDLLRAYICPHCGQKRDPLRNPQGWAIIDYTAN